MKRLLFLVALILGAAVPICAQSTVHYSSPGKIAFMDVKVGAMPGGAPPPIVITKVSVSDYGCITSPGNPAVGINRLYCDIGTGQMACLTSTGAACIVSPTSALTNAGVWNIATPYVVNNVVQFNGSSYVALVNNTGVTPGTDAVTWGIFASAGPAGQNGVNGVNGTPGFSPNQVAAGCGIEWTGSYNFTIGACTYFINSVQYNSPLTNITLSPADATLDRIDTVAVDNTGSVVVLAGTPSANPAPPSADLTTQLSIGFIYVTAGSTAPPQNIVTNIYLENTEWTSVASGSGIALASTNNPYQGTKDVEWTATIVGNYAQFTVSATPTVDLSTYNSLVFYIRSKAAWATNRSVTVEWLNAGTLLGSTVILANGAFNFSSSVTTNYQQVSIPTSLFNLGATPVTTLRFIESGNGNSTIGFYLDNITLQGGTSNPTIPSNIMLYGGTYSSTVGYVKNNVVTSGGLSYIALQPNTGQALTNTAFWVPMAQANTIQNCAQYGLPYYSSAGTTNTLGCLAPPIINGMWEQVANVTASAAVPTTFALFGMGGRSITGATATATVAYSDNATVITHDVGGSVPVTVTLPTATTLLNPKFVWSYANHDAVDTDTITPTTWTIQSATSAAGATLSVPPGAYCRIKVDPNSATNWLADCNASVAGTGTVTSVATSSPITGGTITTTGTIACATCINTGASATAGAHTYDFSGVTLFKLRVSAGLTTSANGDVGYDTTNKNWHAWTNAADKLVGVWSAVPTTGNCVSASVSASTVLLLDAGAPCAAGGTGTVTSVATTAPISGGTITATGTLSCPTCAIGPGSSTTGHVATFASADGLTLADGGAVATGTVTGTGTSPKLATWSSSTAITAIGTPTTCSATQAAAGIDSSGNATGCFTPAGSSGYSTVDSNGTAVTQRSILNFIPAGSANVSCVDNSGATRTDCTVTGINGPPSPTVNTISGTTYTVANSDNSWRDKFTSASAVAVTLPQANTITSSPFVGQRAHVSVSSCTNCATGNFTQNASDLLIATAGGPNITATVSSVTDTAGDTFFKCAPDQANGAGAFVYSTFTYCAYSIAASGSNAVTYHMSGSGNIVLTVNEYSIGSGVLDHASSATATSGGNGTVSTSVSITNTNALAYATFSTGNCPTGWTGRGTGGSSIACDQYLTSQATSTFAGTFNNATVSASLMSFPISGTASFTAGWYALFQNAGTNLVTITPTTSTIGGASTLVIRPNETCEVMSDGTNYNVSWCAQDTTFSDVKFIPAANCNNVTGGNGWSIGSGGTVTCRAGTNNLGGYVSITDTSSTFATFQLEIPEDWDTTNRPYIRFQLASTDATNGHTIIPSIQVACYKGDGSTTDDVAANAAHSLSTTTLNGNANRFWSTSNVQMNSTDTTGCVAGALMQITVGRATDTATNAEFYGATVTIPRLLRVQAN